MFHQAPTAMKVKGCFSVWKMENWVITEPFYSKPATYGFFH